MFITSTANYNRNITVHRPPDLPTYIHIHSGRRGVTFSWVSWSLSGNNPLQMRTVLKQKMQLMSTWVFEFDTQILFDDPSRCNAITSWWVQGRQRGCHRAGKGSKEEGSVACIAILYWEGRVVVELNYINDDDALMYSKERTATHKLAYWWQRMPEAVFKKSILPPLLRWKCLFEL